MNVRELIDQLLDFDFDLAVEIATSPHKDEWYELIDIETDTNLKGDVVVVINTD